MNQLLNKITKNFILNEGKSPTFSVWIQSLQDNLNSLRPKTTSDKRRVELMKHQLKFQKIFHITIRFIFMVELEWEKHTF